MASQACHLVFSQAEHEIGGKALKIALNGLIENFGRHAVKLREVRVENDLFMTEVVDERDEFLRQNQG